MPHRLISDEESSIEEEVPSSQLTKKASSSSRAKRPSTQTEIIIPESVLQTEGEEEDLSGETEEEESPEEVGSEPDEGDDVNECDEAEPKPAEVFQPKRAVRGTKRKKVPERGSAVSPESKAGGKKAKVSQKAPVGEKKVGRKKDRKEEEGRRKEEDRPRQARQARSKEISPAAPQKAVRGDRKVFQRKVKTLLNDVRLFEKKLSGCNEFLGQFDRIDKLKLW